MLVNKYNGANPIEGLRKVTDSHAW